MGRNLSSNQRDAYIADWRERLVDAYEAGATLSDRHDRLIATISGPSKKLAGERSRAIAAALPALLKALRRDDEQPEIRHRALEAWIDRYLLARGNDLLITVAERKAHLGLCRDRRRREVHAGRGLHSTRIEVGLETMEKLKALRPLLKFDRLGEGIEKVVDLAYAHHRAGPKKAGRSKTFAPSPSSDGQPTLL